MFLELNKTPSRDTIFDDVQVLRNAVGSVLKAICSCCPTAVIYSFFQQALKQACDLFQQSANLQDVKVAQVRLEALIEIECVLFCITELTKTLKPTEIATLSEVVQLVH
jgi:hypothetical protein